MKMKKLLIIDPKVDDLTVRKWLKYIINIIYQTTEQVNVAILSEDVW